MYSYDYTRLADSMEDLMLADYSSEEIADVAKNLHILMRRKVTSEELSNIDSSDFTIDYYFPKSIRRNRVGRGRYGASGMTQRRLFEILIALNGGDDFIQRYFIENYPTRLKQDVDNYLTESLHELNINLFALSDSLPLTKKGVPDKRYNITKEFESLRTERNKLYSVSKQEVAFTIKNDIISCLRNGIIRLNFELSKATMKQRARLGLQEKPAFYATGNFIKSIVIVFRYNKDVI